MLGRNGSQKWKKSNVEEKIQLERKIKVEIFNSDNENWDKEANVWAAFYMFYDDNSQHMITAFENNGYYDASPDTIRKSNLEWASFLLSFVSEETLLGIIPEAAEYINEVKQHEKIYSQTYHTYHSEFRGF